MIVPDIVQFVDTISASPTVRLDLNDDVNWGLKYDGTDLSPPDLRRGVAQTLLSHGGIVTASAYDNRVLRLRLELSDTSPDTVAARLQALTRELNRPPVDFTGVNNILKWQPGTSAPVFFRTIRSPINRITEVPGPGTLKLIDVDILAAPTGRGLREDLPQVTVYNDPADGTTQNANPFFETDISNWSAIGAGISRSTAQFHEGIASLLLAPDGVTANVEARSDAPAAAPGQQWRASAWVRCAVARTVSVGIVWRDAVSGFISSSLTPVSVAANTWTLIDTGALTAPASTAFAQLTVAMGGTPTASHLLYIDEARLRLAGGVGGCCFDVSSIKGDVETPLYITVPSSNSNFVTSDPASSRVSAVAVRRRGTPSAAPFVLQAESMSMASVDTTVQANNTAFSGSGSNWTRTTFATTTSMAARLSISQWPAAASKDVRGTYRVFMRYRPSTVTPGVMQARLKWGTSNTFTTNDTVTLIGAYGGAPASPYLLYADLGIVQFPQGYDPVSDGPDGVELPVEGMALQLEAARVSGSASLDIDFLAFVPADDRLLLVTWPASPTLPATLTLDSDKGQVYVEGSAGVVGRSGAQLAGGPPLVMPGVTNRITWMRDVGQTSSTGSGAMGDEITATTVLAPYYWPEYLYARPPSS